MICHPDYDTFKKIARPGTLVPVFGEFLADMETPVTTLMKFAGKKEEVFLLESVEGGEKWGRYSFLGCDPRMLYTVKGESVEIRENGSTRVVEHGGDPLAPLREILAAYRPVMPGGDLPRFFGGAVGYLGYDMVTYFEDMPRKLPDDIGMADACFMVTDGAVIFDNVRHTIKVVSCAFIDEGADLQSLYDSCIGRIKDRAGLILSTIAGEPGLPESAGNEDKPTPLIPREKFISMVERARDYINEGDIIQVVLSQRFQKRSKVDPLRLYRALRYVNPSPYLFFLKLGEGTLIGSSPEVMVRLEEGVAELRPIAGTRKRGRNEQEDRRLADELLRDPKERAEHVMLVDLGRNDLGRIARVGSVQVTQLMSVERYSHVMHLVSTIKAQLEKNKDCFDVLAAVFPAGTLSGAPKIRAMEIIEELEQVRRGPYGGAVGYIGYSGNMDMCITIRTILLKDDRLYIQTGAGIVADSDPFREYEETMNKAAAMMEALKLAATDFSIAARRERM